MICHPGSRCTSRRSAGWRRGALRRWSTIYGRCCGWPQVARPSHPRQPDVALHPPPAFHRCCASSEPWQASPESGERAGYDGGKRKKDSKIHMAVDTLGHLLALHVTPASAEDRGEVGRLARTVQDVTGDSVDIAYVDQGYTGTRAADVEVVKLPEAKRGFVLLPRRWVVERSFAWATRFRRLVKDYERHAETLAGLHVVAFACLMMKQAAALAAGP